MKIFLVFTFAAFIQLCPAPFVLAIIAGATEAIQFIAGGVEAGVEGIQAGAIGGAAGGLQKRDQQYRSSQPTKESLQACWRR
jgi:hypothetical protein